MLSKYPIPITFIVASLLVLLAVYFLNTMSNSNTSAKQDTVVQVEEEMKLQPTHNDVVPVPTTETLPVFTAATLATFNGEDSSLPIYIAFEGNVYDVTGGRKFYGADGHYHFLAGTDGTKLLKIFGGSTIKKKYPVVGTFSP